MKGKLCFIKRKSKILVSNARIFCEKNILFFENRERSNKNLWTFLREQVLKGNNPLYNRGFTCFLLSSRLRTLFYLLVQRYKVLFLHAIERPIFSPWKVKVCFIVCVCGGFIPFPVGMVEVIRGYFLSCGDIWCSILVYHYLFAVCALLVSLVICCAACFLIVRYRANNSPFCLLVVYIGQRAFLLVHIERYYFLLCGLVYYNSLLSVWYYIFICL